MIKSDSSDCFIFSKSPFPQVESISTISIFFFQHNSVASWQSWISQIHRRRFVMHPCRTFLMFSHSCSDSMISCDKVLIMTNKSETPREILTYSIYSLWILYFISRHEDQLRTRVLMNKKWRSMRNVDLLDKFRMKFRLNSLIRSEILEVTSEIQKCSLHVTLSEAFDE